MVYRTRPGIVLVRICGEDLLVATHEVWDNCPVIRPIPKLWAACWKIMEKGKTDKDVIAAFAPLLRKPEDVIRERFSKIFTTLTSEGLMVESEDETE